jgi:hypothetical protein
MRASEIKREREREVWPMKRGGCVESAGRLGTERGDSGGGIGVAAGVDSSETRCYKGCKNRSKRVGTSYELA